MATSAEIDGNDVTCAGAMGHARDAACSDCTQARGDLPKRALNTRVNATGLL